MKKFFAFIIMSLFLFVACNNTASKNAEATKKVETVQVAKEIPPAPTGHVKTDFNLVWSIYVGWNPWYYGQFSNILDKWGKKYGINISLNRMGYIPSIEAYVAKQYDACVMTNMDLLTMPINAGVNSTVAAVGDYSNGNDAVVTKDPNITSLRQVKKLWGVQYSVSHYLKSRGEDKNGMAPDAIEMVNISEDEIVGMFANNPEITTVVTWNPFLMDVLKVKGARKLFSSSEIPGEILDLLVINSKTLEENPDLGRALVGAWYEVMEVMSAKNEKAMQAIEIMAKVGGSSVMEFNTQLSTTAMFYKPQEAINFSIKPDFVQSMERVRNFCVKYDLLKGIKNPDDLGIQMPNEIILGSQSNVRLKFDMSYTQAAARGEL